MTRPQAVLWGTLSVAAHALVLAAWPVPSVTLPDEPVAVEVGLIRSQEPPSAGGSGGLPGKAKPASGEADAPPTPATAPRAAVRPAVKPAAKPPRPRQRIERTKPEPPVQQPQPIRAVPDPVPPEPTPPPPEQAHREPPAPPPPPAREQPPLPPPPAPPEAEPPAAPEMPPPPARGESPDALPAESQSVAGTQPETSVENNTQTCGAPCDSTTGGGLAKAESGGAGGPGPGGGGASQTPQVEAAPDYAENPRPPYPWIARRRGWEGEVRLRIRVSAGGRVLDARVERSTGHSVLDEAALATVREWRFRPALADGVPVESTVLVPLRFALETRE